MRLLLSTVFLHFDLDICEESKDWKDQKVFTLWEKRPLMCKLTEVVKGDSNGDSQVQRDESSHARKGPGSMGL